MKPIRGILLNKSHPLARNLIADWPCNEGTGKIVSDLSGNRHTGIIAGAVWKPGKYGSGSALDFVTNDYVEIADSPILAPQNFTIIVGFKADTLATNGHYALVAKWGALAANQSYYLTIYDSNSNGDLQIRGAIRDSGGAAPSIQGITTLITGQHYIAILTYKSGVSLDLYLDGKYEGQEDTILNPGVRIGTENLYFGARAGGATSNLDGLIDFARMYNRTLAAAEITLLCRELSCMYEERTLPTRLLIPTVLTDYNKNKILEHIVGKTSLTTASVSVALGTAGDGYGSFTEVANANNYSRFATNALDWNVASNGEITNRNDIAFHKAIGAWGEISHYALFDSSVYGEGNLLLVDALDTPKDILAKDIMVLNKNDLKITLD